MERTELRTKLEALLFAADQPLTIGTLRKLVPELEGADLRGALEELRDHYASVEHGVLLAELAGGFQFVTKPEHAGAVEGLVHGKRKTRLSRAALETLAIIAYKQPVTRLAVERIRGVDAGGVLRTLLERELVTIRGRDAGPGRPLLYGTTAEFLAYFGLNALAELPRLEELEALAEARQASRAEEAGLPAAAGDLFAPEPGGGGTAERIAIGEDRPSGEHEAAAESLGPAEPRGA
jgi:segregation and condensation protein B